MAIKTLTAVRAICEYRNWEVSNLVIQKILYIAQMIYIGQKSESRDSINPLINSNFFAWAYGPVVPDVYRQLKMFGADNVEKFLLLTSEPNPNNEEPEFLHLKTICDVLTEYTPGQLVAITHDIIGAWHSVYDATTGDTLISKENIYDEYHGRQQRKI